MSTPLESKENVYADLNFGDSLHICKRVCTRICSNKEFRLWFTVAISLILFVTPTIVGSVRYGIDWRLIMAYTVWFYCILSSLVFSYRLYYEDYHGEIFPCYLSAMIINAILAPIILFSAQAIDILDFRTVIIGLCIDAAATISLVCLLALMKFLCLSVRDTYYSERRKMIEEIARV